MGSGPWQDGFTWDEVIEHIGNDLPMRRSFDNNLPSDFAHSNAAYDVGKRISVYGMKVGMPWKEWAAGKADDQVHSILAGWPDEKNDRVIIEHEPENDPQDRLFWLAGQTRMTSIFDDINANRKFKLRRGLGLMAYTAHSSDRDKWLPDGKIDFMAFDGYAWGWEAPNPRSGEAIFDSAMNWTHEHKLNFNVAEHGVSRVHPGRKAWILNARAWFESVDCKWASYWNNQDMILNTDAQWALFSTPFLMA